jgi:antitoxin VapB
MFQLFPFGVDGIYRDIYQLEVPMTQSAKIFMNGRSQAVRLPAEFRFDTKEVYIRRDAQTGDVILSEKSDKAESWDEFFRLRDEADVPDDFLSPEERNQSPLRPDPFEGWEK